MPPAFRRRNRKTKTRKTKPKSLSGLNIRKSVSGVKLVSAGTTVAGRDAIRARRKASTPVRVKTETKSLSGSKKRKAAPTARRKPSAAATKPTRIDLSEVQKRRVKRRATFDKLQENKERRDKQMAAYDKSHPTPKRKARRVPASKPQMEARQKAYDSGAKPPSRTKKKPAPSVGWKANRVRNPRLFIEAMERARKRRLARLKAQGAGKRTRKS